MFPPTLQTHDGLQLRTFFAYPATETPQARVILLHGLGDHAHALPYRHVTDYLVAQKMAVYAFDLRGHGQSEGPRMFVNAWSDIQTDVCDFVTLVQHEAPAKPLFLLGLSMGGLIALHHAIHHPEGITGVVVGAPAVGPPGIPALLKKLMPILSRIMPRASLNPGLDYTRLSRDASAAQAYTADPSFQTKTTPRLAAEVLTSIDWVRTLAPQLSLPLLILHGTEDTLVPPAGSADFYKKVGSTDKTRITYPGAYHNLFLEIHREQVFSDIVRWMQKHLEELPAARVEHPAGAGEGDTACANDTRVTHQ